MSIRLETFSGTSDVSKVRNIEIWSPCVALADMGQTRYLEMGTQGLFVSRLLILSWCLAAYFLPLDVSQP